MFFAILTATFAVLTDIFLFHRNIAILLDEVNTNALKLHISQNSFTVNMYRNECMVGPAIIYTFKSFYC